MATFAPLIRRPAAAGPSAASAREAPAGKTTPAEDLAARLDATGRSLIDRVLPPSLAVLPISNPSDPAERQADRIATDIGRGPGPSTALRSLAEQTRDEAAPRGVAPLSSGGTPLPATARGLYEPRFGQSLADVRLHTGPAAASYASAFDARAFSYGDHVFMGAGQRAEPSPLLAHELAHVAQQRASGRLLVARQAAPADDPDRNVKLPALDSEIVAEIGSEVLGEIEFTLLRELVRGMVGGAAAAPPEQLAQIRMKFAPMGLRDSVHLAEGFGIGVGLGLWSSVTGLFEAILHLVTLPYDIEQFLDVKLPNLVTKYGPRLMEIGRDGEALAAAILQTLQGFRSDPAEGARQAAKLLEGLREIASAKVRALGRDAVQRIMAFLAEPWEQFGEDIGKIVGMVLFEVLLALGTDLIGNIAKEAGELAGRLAARVLGSAVELFAAARRVVGTALEAVERLGGRLGGKLGELFQQFKRLLRRLLGLIEDMVPELQPETGLPIRVPETPKPNVFESRAHKPPDRTTPTTVGDLRPEKVHPSKAAEAPPASQGKLPQFLRNKLKRINNEVAAGGNRGISGSVSIHEARQLGEAFVGPGYRATNDGTILISQDGLRQFRLPSQKTGINPRTMEPFSRTGVQANFEARPVSSGKFQSNVHLDVTP